MPRPQNHPNVLFVQPNWNLHKDLTLKERTPGCQALNAGIQSVVAANANKIPALFSNNGFRQRTGVRKNTLVGAEPVTHLLIDERRDERSCCSVCYSNRL